MAEPDVTQEKEDGYIESSSSSKRLIGWKLQIFPSPLSFNALACGEPFQISGQTLYHQD